MLFIVLEKEYGYILPELKNFKDFEIMSAYTDIIDAGNKLHYRKLEKNVVYQYKDYDLAIGVGILEDERIRLIDGYHRFAAKQNSRTVKIIVGVK